ncbi:MAG: WD40 repeat domain-containing protein [Planctomycetes bacterium]|nr:WD40 repeat domain-containing protein [Planctomycetota bacterium]
MPANPTQTHVEKTLTHTAPFWGCRYDPTGRFIFAGGEDSKVVRFDVASGTKVELVEHDSWVRALAFNKSGDVLVSGGYDGRLIWWSATADAPAVLRKVDAHAGWVRALAVSPDGNLLVSCGDDKKVKVWNLSDGSLVRELVGHERHVYNVAFHPDGKQLASGDLTAKFIHWEVETGMKVRDFAIASLSKYDPGFMADYGGPYSMAFAPDGKRLLAGGITNVSNAFAAVGNPILVEIDWETGKETIAHSPKGTINGKVFGLALHPDGYLIGSTGGGGGGHLYFWKPTEKEEFHTLNLENTTRDMSLHPDGLHIATCHHDKQIRISLMGPKVG